MMCLHRVSSWEPGTLQPNTILIYVTEFYESNPSPAFIPSLPLSRFCFGPMISTLPILSDIKLVGLMDPSQFWLCSSEVFHLPHLWFTQGLPKPYFPTLYITSIPGALNSSPECPKSKWMSPNSLALNLPCQLDSFSNTSKLGFLKLPRLKWKRCFKPSCSGLAVGQGGPHPASS